MFEVVKYVEDDRWSLFGLVIVSHTKEACARSLWSALAMWLCTCIAGKGILKGVCWPCWWKHPGIDFWQTLSSFCMIVAMYRTHVLSSILALHVYCIDSWTEPTGNRLNGLHAPQIQVEFALSLDTQVRGQSTWMSPGEPTTSRRCSHHFYMDLSPYIFFLVERWTVPKTRVETNLYFVTSRRVALAPGSIQWTKCTGNSWESSEKHLPHLRHRPKRGKSDLIADRQAGKRMCEDV